MMLLRHLDLYLNLDEYPKDLATPFGFRTRYLCNFLERRVRQLKFHADGFSKICVQGRHVPEDGCPIVSENAAVPTVRFDEERYLSFGRSEGRHEFYVSMLLEGLEKCARFHRIPLKEIRDAIDDFRRAGYKNEWTHAKKTFSEIGMVGTLLCSLDTERFVLTMRLERKHDVLFEEPILETKPDETIFGYRFKDMVLDGDSLIVRDKFLRPTFSLDLRSLRTT